MFESAKNFPLYVFGIVYKIFGENLFLCMLKKIPLVGTLQRQFCLYIPFLGIARPQPQFHIPVSMSDLYIPRIGPHISAEKADPS